MKSVSDAVRHDALASSVAIRLPLCSFDELRVLDAILERILKVGRESYAPLDLARDERDWGREAADELADTLFYLAAREVAANDRRLERLRCEAADELKGLTPIERGLRELADNAPDVELSVRFDVSDLDDARDIGGEA
jgi:hypothetical protein